ncbi:MAG: diphthamide biosynthesis enzyme Dph2 [Candidatus Micrarchaeota archaeon]|nr:diphthamide biosynthesis enzyme Dph2 [Candidatus Micrarchaeota archaeon]
MRIIIQFPEGLKAKALEEAERLEAQGHEVFLSASPCYGACDLCLDEARHVKADKIIHFGHAEFMKVQSPVKLEYVPYFSELDWKMAGELVERAASMLHEIKAKKVALVFPVQHLKSAGRVKERLEAAGLKVLMKKGGAHTQHRGQVLGCDVEAGKVKEADAVLYFGGGKFHPLGLPSSKPVLVADPHLGDAYWITDEIKRLEKKKQGSMLAASKAKTFGILVSTKCGQINLNGARMAKRMLEKKGKKAAILVANELNPIALQNFMSFEAYINTACPRINEDTESYGKPIVNLADLKRLLELMV